MRTPDPRLDLGSGEWYQPVSMPLPRRNVLTARYRHTCPDGTLVRVCAQHVPATGATLYRWRVDGEPAGTTAVAGRAGEPDWAPVDALHPLFLDEAALAGLDAVEYPREEIEMEPDCYVCGDAGCAYCQPGVDREVLAGPEFPADPVLEAVVEAAPVPVVITSRGGLPW